MRTPWELVASIVESDDAQDDVRSTFAATPSAGAPSTFDVSAICGPWSSSAMGYTASAFEISFIDVGANSVSTFERQIQP